MTLQAMSPRTASQLAAAERVADMLCATAIWGSNGQTCNWISASPIPGNATLRPLGFDLYTGLGGIALFLAGAHLSSGKGQYREASVAALRAAHLQAQNLPSSAADLSLFEGRFGLHFITGQISTLLQVPASADTLRAVQHLVHQAALFPHSFDVMFGSAGAICGLLNFEPREFRPHLLPLATRLGEVILNQAEQTKDGFIWRPRDASGVIISGAPLCGISHGASGIALSLLKLFHATGRSEFLTGARAAFAYEDGAFSHTLGSWPDLRVQDPHSKTTEAGFDAWCHGAGGITVARLQAMSSDLALLESHRHTAITALERTKLALRNLLDAPERDESLCHGVVGLAQICRVGDSAMSMSITTPEVEQAADSIAQRINGLGDISSWPGSLSMMPGLMLGCSGVAYGLLGLAGVPLPSPINLFESFR